MPTEAISEDCLEKANAMMPFLWQVSRVRYV